MHSTILDEEIRNLSIESLSNRCAQETGRFYQRGENDERFCFEIFRRAIQGQDQQAWEMLYALYQEQMARWVRRHPAFTASGEDETFFINRAFEKFWKAIPPDRFTRFPDLKRLLGYLKLCVFSVLTDYRRAAFRLEEDLNEDIYIREIQEDASIEERVLARSQARELWRMVVERMQDQKEIQVAYDAFVLNLKPAETLDHYPGTYENIREIYRIKENLLVRLRRDTEFLNSAGLIGEEWGGSSFIQ